MQNIKIINYSKKISFIFLIYGIAIRLYQFINNRPLWGDEMQLLSAIIEKKYTDLLPLANDQIAPIAFVYLTKILLSINNFTNFFDINFIVRFLPLIASIGSLILFYKICKDFYFTRVILIFIFSASPKIIYYSSEFKQYSLDIFFALLLFFTYDRMLKFKKKNNFFLTTGCLAIFFSHTSIIILVSILVHWLWNCFKLKKNYNFLLAINYSFFFFLLFVVNYFFFLRFYSENVNILNFWANKYLKFPLTLLDIYQNLKIFLTFYIFSGFLISIFPVIFILCLIACKDLFKNNMIFLQLSVIIFIVSCFLSFFKIYPFYLRLSLFYIPLFYIIIGYGLEKICSRQPIFLFTFISAIIMSNFFLHFIDNFKIIDLPQHTNETNVIYKLEKKFFINLLSKYVN